MSERWLPVPTEGFEDLYEVSDLGNVRSLDRMIWSRGRKSQYLKPGRLLSPTPDTHGYLSACLTDSEGRQVSVLIHHLVLRAFVGPPPAGQEARHGPGGQRDNRLINLSYGTSSQNMFDKWRDGTMVHGVRSHKAKLNDDIVRECRERYKPYATDSNASALAREFGVSEHTMWCAVTGKTWRHIGFAS